MRRVLSFLAIQSILFGALACAAPETEMELPGRDPKLRWDAQGRLHGGTGWGEPVRLTDGEALYPRLAVHGDRAVLAYTQYVDGEPRVVVRDLRL